jgi:hypothetical protein
VSPQQSDSQSNLIERERRMSSRVDRHRARSPSSKTLKAILSFGRTSPGRATDSARLAAVERCTSGDRRLNSQRYDPPTGTASGERQSLLGLDQGKGRSGLDLKFLHARLVGESPELPPVGAHVD